jgi:hypothetical protein
MTPQYKAQIQRQLAAAAEHRAKEAAAAPVVANKPSRHGKHAPASKPARNAYMADLMRKKRAKP